MKSAIIAFLVISAYCTLVSHGLFFSSSKKPICEQHPCKNKGTCKPDAKNASMFTCTCPEGYFGVKCELKTGCQPKPCKKGTCINDRVNLANYTCKCNAGIVGKNCDTADACAKNPCKSGSKCSLDPKLKAVCLCPPGWMSKSCDKRNCTIVEFKGKHFISKPKVFIDEAIKSKFEKFDELAKLCNVKIQPIRSFSLQPDPKANADNNNAPFYIGRGLQFEVHDNNGKLLCNAVCLGKVPIPAAPAKCLVDGLNAIQWKWSILNPGVIHDGSHVANLNGYNLLKEYKQVGCKDGKF